MLASPTLSADLKLSSPRDCSPPLSFAERHDLIMLIFTGELLFAAAVPGSRLTTFCAIATAGAVFFLFFAARPPTIQPWNLSSFRGMCAPPHPKPLTQRHRLLGCCHSTAAQHTTRPRSFSIPSELPLAHLNPTTYFTALTTCPCTCLPHPSQPFGALAFPHLLCATRSRRRVWPPHSRGCPRRTRRARRARRRRGVDARPRTVIDSRGRDGARLRRSTDACKLRCGKLTALPACLE